MGRAWRYEMSGKSITALSLFAVALALVACTRPQATTAQVPDRLAFTMEKDGQLDIYTSDLDGKKLLRVTNTTEVELRPTWSPNGERIAFVVGGTIYSGGSLYTIRSRGGGPELDVKPVGVGHAQPVVGWSWSPDSTMLAYHTIERYELGLPRDATLHVIDVLRGMELATVSNAWFPVWLPTGEELIFVRIEPGQSGSSAPEVLSLRTGQTRPIAMSIPEGLDAMIPLTIHPSGGDIYWIAIPDRANWRRLPAWFWVSDTSGQNAAKVAKLAEAPLGRQFGWLLLLREVVRLGANFRAWSPSGDKLAVLSLKDPRKEPDDRLPDSFDISYFEVSILSRGRGQPSASVLPFETLLFGYADDLRDGDLKNVNRLESNISIDTLSWSGDAKRLIYSVSRSGEGSRFFWYSPNDGARGEILAEVDPANKAFLTCCGR